MKSFLFELKGKGEVIFNVVRKGDYRIEDDVITFYFEDTNKHSKERRLF